MVPDWQVPPAEVLQKMVPEESLAVLEEWTWDEYQGKRRELMDLKAARVSNLAGGNFVRKKREVGPCHLIFRPMWSNLIRTRKRLNMTLVLVSICLFKTEQQKNFRWSK